MQRIAIVVVVSCLASACANNFETRRFDWSTGQPETINPNNPSTTPIGNGLIYYEPRLFKVTTKFSQRIDAQGIVTPSSTDPTPCDQVVVKEEVLVLPDYKNPRVIINKPPLLGAGSFTINFKDGMVTSLNAVSTPQTPQLIQSLIKPIDLMAKMEEPSPRAKACNAGPIITDVDYYTR